MNTPAFHSLRSQQNYLRSGIHLTLVSHTTLIKQGVLLLTLWFCLVKKFVKIYLKYSKTYVKSVRNEAL